MVFEIISLAILIDSAIAVFISVTKFGDESIEKNFFIKRYFPLTNGWSILYFALSLYVGYLTFFVL